MKTLRRNIVMGAILLSLAISIPPLSGQASSREINFNRTQMFDNLIQKAEQHGAVRVIVSLNVPFQPEGDLVGAAAVDDQRARIQSAQDGLLASLAGEQVSSVKRFQFQPGMAMTISPQALDKLRADPEVASVVEDRLAKVSLSESVPLIGATPDKTHGFTGAGWAVAILDTGVDKTHPFLAGKVVSEACYSTTDYDYDSTSVCPGGVPSSTDPGSGVNCSVGSDDCYHGTHVAGIATGHHYGSVAMDGVARDASIIAIQVFSEFGYDYCHPDYECVMSWTDDQIAGLERVYALKDTYNIAAVNMSLGGGYYQSQAYCDSDNPEIKTAIDNLRSVNIPTVIASGNDGYTSALSAPGCISSAISVGSTKDGSNGAIPVDTVSDFSNSANFLTLLAPGEWINSSIPGGGFAIWRGTSMATPHVAGAFALLKSSRPTATIKQMLDALTSTGKKITDSRSFYRHITKPRIQVNAAIDQLNMAVKFDNTSYSFSESTGHAVVNVVLSSPSTAIVKVNYATSDGTALAGTDYTVASGQLTFQIGQTSQQISIPIIDNAVHNLDKTFNLTLSSPSGADLGSPSSVVVTILDDDIVTAQYGSSAYGICKGADSITLYTTLTVPTYQTVTVQYATSDDTALAGINYVSSSGTLTFLPGETSQSAEIALLDDGDHTSGTRVFHVTLSSPTNAILGSQSSTGVEMRDYCVFVPLKAR